MGQHLVLTVRFPPDGAGTARFHGMNQGSPEWPPSPARVFQALIAGGARGDGLPEVLARALEWLEALAPPQIAAAERALGQRLALFVPNNDADALDDPRDVSAIRTKKVVQPSLFPAETPILYVWSVPTPNEHATVIVAAASDLHQLGRGVDMAWAEAALLDDASLDALLDAHPGILHRPTLGASGDQPLACPVAGSLASLEARHRSVKLRTEGSGRAARVLFTNPPKPRFALVDYARARRWSVFELRDRETGKPWPWSLTRAVSLVETLRDQAAARLRQSLVGAEAAVASTLIGRKPDGSDPTPPDARVRIVPLPSIGFEHADRAIRRFAIDVPSGARLRADDVEWAFSGLATADLETGEPGSVVVARAEDRRMFDHYVGPSRHFRTVTPAALPESAGRRRIKPALRREEAKPARERAEEEARAAGAIRAALRHADVRARAVEVHVQREPFDAHGARAEPFAEGTRFAKERLWHFAIELDRSIEGPLLLGDGRFLGLGLLAPWRGEVPGLHAFDVVEGLVERHATADIAHALRRAVMARVQQVLGTRAELPTFFSGHADDGSRAREQSESHLAFAFDPVFQRLLVIAPHFLARRDPLPSEHKHFKALGHALRGLSELRAGSAGRLALRPATIDMTTDHLFSTSRSWSSITPYIVTRHAKAANAEAALAENIIAECGRADLPRPRVTVENVRGIPRRGLTGYVRLDFDVALPGLLLLGRGRFGGEGLFGKSSPE